MEPQSSQVSTGEKPQAQRFEEPSVNRYLAAVAGTWHMHTLNLAGDKILLRYDIAAKDTPEGWTLHIPGRAPIRVDVLEVTGDSIVAEIEHASELRENARVTSRFIMQFHEDRVEGILVSKYKAQSGKFTVPYRVDGTRAR